MSGVLGAVVGTAATPFINQAEQFLDSIMIRAVRGFDDGGDGLIVPDCAVEEIERNEMEITEHPVETGASVTDHSFKKPAEVTLRWSWSNSSIYNFLGTEDYAKMVYQMLLGLQNSRVPFTLYTGKNVYPNMLFASLGVTTDATSEYVLNIVALCKQIIIVSTSTANVAPSNVQQNPQQTAPVQNTGAKTPDPPLPVPPTPPAAPAPAAPAPAPVAPATTAAPAAGPASVYPMPSQQGVPDFGALQLSTGVL